MLNQPALPPCITNELLLNVSYTKRVWKHLTLTLKLFLMPKKNYPLYMWRVSESLSSSSRRLSQPLLSWGGSRCCSSALLTCERSTRAALQILTLCIEKKENARRSSSWELTPPRQPQTVNYRGAYMIPAFPRGHQTVGRGSVKLGPRSLHFRSASALLFRRVGSIPRRLQGGCTGLCELSCLFWLLRCFKTSSLVLKNQHFKAERLQNNCRFMSFLFLCVCCWCF